MIEIKVITDAEKSREYLSRHGAEGKSLLAATDGEEIIAYTIFSVDGKTAEIQYIVPEEDILLADGMIRSTIHVVLSRGALAVHYADSVSEKLLKTLDFILDSEKKLLDSDKLYRACCCEK